MSLRQFRCDTEECECKGKRWLKRAMECECRECEEPATLIPEGEEVGVFVFQFNCECGNTYTVICRRQDEAECYQCDKLNSPQKIVPSRRAASRSENHHGCTRCPNGDHDECQNLLDFNA